MAQGSAPPALISMPEIADLAGVRRPVVTTWRRRHAGFPQPVTGDGGRPLFDAGQVVDWLVATGRADRGVVEPDLRLHLLATLAAQPGGRRGGLPPRDLVATLTALVCLRHLDDEPLVTTTGQRPWRLVTALRERAATADPEDTLLRMEIEALRPEQVWLAGAVDGLVEAAWGAGLAYERILAARGRFGVGELDADAISPTAAVLVAGLSGAGERPAFLARLPHRRLAVRGLPPSDVTVHTGAELRPAGPDADLLVTRLPYRPKEQRGGADPFAAVRRLTEALAPGHTVVMHGPADLLVGALPPYQPASRSRNALLADGRVEAVIALPGGVVPFRPAYQTGLWVLRREEPSPWQGRVLLADVSDRPLTGQVVEALVWDITTWRRHGHRPDQHLRAHAAQVSVAELVAPRVPLTTRRPPRLADLAAPQRAIARVVELEADLDPAGAGRPAAPWHSGLSARDEPVTVPRRAMAALVRDGLLAMAGGSRLAPEHVTGDGHHRVIGAPELCGSGPVGARTVDRSVLADRYPRLRLTEPGDVIVTLAPRLGVHMDRDGYAVAEFPVRVLRIPVAGRERFTPAVLAALLVALPEVGQATTRAPGAVRPPAGWPTCSFRCSRRRRWPGSTRCWPLPRSAARRRGGRSRWPTSCAGSPPTGWWRAH